VSEANRIVYVEFGHCAFGHLNGCLLPFAVPTTGGRYRRIVVTPDHTRVDHDGLIALLAHELQHDAQIVPEDLPSARKTGTCRSHRPSCSK
jgi:hypothetical protein